MNRRKMVFAMAFVLAAAPGIALGATKAEKQAEVRKAAQAALNAVYKAQPSARKTIESAAGYAAFSNFGMKILVAGGGSGEGIAVNNKTKATTYMKMAEVQAGIGFGAKKFQVVWVFETEAALNNFINAGWEFGGQATAAAKAGDKGSAYQRPGARTHRQGHQVLQGQRSELRSAQGDRVRPVEPMRGIPVPHQHVLLSG
jgi:lipid-binding SYLF domain-containing protein